MSERAEYRRERSRELAERWMRRRADRRWKATRWGRAGDPPWDEDEDDEEEQEDERA